MNARMLQSRAKNLGLAPILRSPQKSGCEVERPPGQSRQKDCSVITVCDQRSGRSACSQRGGASIAVTGRACPSFRFGLRRLTSHVSR